MIYGYARVSTKGQGKDGNSLESQEQQLRQKGAEVIYSDIFTGTKTERPELNKLLEVLSEGDTLIVTKLDRLARSVALGTTLIEELLSRGVEVEVLNLGKLSNSTLSKLMRDILLAFAEMERNLIVERCQEGKVIARQNPNYREGRPLKYSPSQLEHALSLLGDKSYTQVEALTGISKSTLVRYKRKTV